MTRALPGTSDVFARLGSASRGDLGQAFALRAVLLRYARSDLSVSSRGGAIADATIAVGAEAVGGPPGAFAKVIRGDYAKWARVVKQSGARVD